MQDSVAPSIFVYETCDHDCGIYTGKIIMFDNSKDYDIFPCVAW